MFSTGDRFNHGRRFQRNVIRDVVNDLFWRREVFGKATVPCYPNGVEMFARFRPRRPAEDSLVTVNVRVDANPVANLESNHVLTNFGNDPGVFVT